MKYEYKSTDGLVGPEGRVYGDLEVIFEIERPFGKAEGIGKQIKCPVEGFVGKIERIASSPQIMMRTDKNANLTGVSATALAKDGSPVNMTFLNHSKSDPEVARRMVQGTGATTTPARFDPKLGRTVIDVVSNVKDPLGKISKEKEIKKVNQPYKQRDYKPITKLSPTDSIIPRRPK